MFVLFVVLGIVCVIAAVVMFFIFAEEDLAAYIFLGLLCVAGGIVLFIFAPSHIGGVKFQETILQDSIKVKKGYYRVIKGSSYNLKLSVIKKYDGIPENAPNQFVIQPYDKFEKPIDKLFYVASDSKDSLIYLLKQDPGASAKIRFTTDSFSSALRKTVGSIKFLSAENAGIMNKIDYVVAIAPFTMLGNGFTANSNMAARIAVISGLKSNPRTTHFTCVDTTQLDKIVEQHNFETSDWSSKEKVAEIGRALNANILVTGSLEKNSAGAYEFTLMVIAINTMEVLGAMTGTESSIGGIANAVSTMNITLPK